MRGDGEVGYVLKVKETRVKEESRSESQAWYQGCVERRVEKKNKERK